MIQIEYLPLVLTGIGIIVSILYYTSVLRNANKTQQMQLETRSLQMIMQLHDQMSTPENLKTWVEIMNHEWDDFDDYIMKYSVDANEDAYTKRASILRRYNNMGLFLRDNRIDPDLLYDYIGDVVLLTWGKYEQILKEQRVRYGRPEMVQWFEYLANEMSKVKAKRGYSIPTWPYPKEPPN